MRGSALAAGQRIIHFGNGSGIDFEFTGTGDADSTVDYKLWMVMEPASEQPKDSPSEMELVLFATGTQTLGTKTGTADGVLVTSSEKIADAFTFTLTAAGTALLTNYGLSAPTPFSPGNNGVARLTIPLLSRICQGILPEFELNSGATGANLVYSLTG